MTARRILVTMPITLDIRRELIANYVPLSLHVVWRLVRNGLPFDEALNGKTDLYRCTALYDGKILPDHPPAGWRCQPWERAADALEAILARHEADADSSALEREGYEVLRPLLEPAFERDVAGWPRIENRPYGFFTYQVTDQWLGGQTVITLHLANPFAPASPLADLPGRARELRRLVDDVTGAWARDDPTRPALERIGTGSWLNALPPFARLFPPEWAAGARPFPRLVPGKGWWGQFIDRRGGYHRRNGDHLRRTGRFPYPVLNCTCSVDALRQHLAERFGVTS